jgi:hypothetical protein
VNGSRYQNWLWSILHSNRYIIMGNIFRLGGFVRWFWLPLLIWNS